ncbi:MAG: STAS/SEC14 domain-containing protein [Bacteroidales bacterium]|nr:STAS/SEC14 domain-containing protein [Bacteroidales bacterium]
MIQWKFDRDKDLITAKYTGSISYEEIAQYINDLGRINDLPKKLYILSDYTDADTRLLYRAKRAALVLDDIKDRMRKYDLVKEAILQNNPFGAALANLYITFFRNTKNYKIKLFSTRTAAMAWLES